MKENIEEVDTVQGVICWALSQIANPFESGSIVGEMLNGLRKGTGSSRADLMLYQSDMNILFFSETSTNEEGGPETGQISLTDTKNSAPVAALAGGRTVMVDDLRESGFLSMSPGARTLLAIPVIYAERIHGILSLEHEEPDAFSAEAVRWIQACAAVFAVLLEQSYLNEQVFRLNQRLIDQMTDKASTGDPTYKAHAQSVSDLAGAIAEAMDLDNEMVITIRESGFLHDIGKTGVSSSILVKPGNLSDSERNEVRRHPVLGRFLLKPLGFQPAVIEGVASHHEHWNGKGYPRGLEGDQIPVAGRILAVAEAYDVMTSDQPYRKKLSDEQAMAEIKRAAGTQFDPAVVKVLEKISRTDI